MASYAPSSDLDPAGQIIALGHASGFLTRGDLKALDIGCEVTKEVLRRRVVDLVDAALGCPILTSKSCDGTPMNLAHWSSHLLPNGKKVKTRGREGREFLVANQFVRAYLPDDSVMTAVLLSEAVPLHEGKSAAAILAAANQGWMYLRDHGHLGPLIDHFVWDRAGLTRLEHDSRLWHAARNRPAPPKDMSPETFALLDFVVVTPCALHDAQNAFRWGQLQDFQNRSLMRDLYISVESLRNSADLISSRVGGWVASKIRLAPPRDESWISARRQLLEALGVDVETSAIIVDDLQLCWEGDQLMVWDGYQVVRTKAKHRFTAR